MSYQLELLDGIVLARGLPGPTPALADVVEVDGRSWRVLERRHRINADRDESEQVVEPETRGVGEVHA